MRVRLDFSRLVRRNPILDFVEDLFPVRDGFFLTVLDDNFIEGMCHARHHVIGQIGFSPPDKLEHDVIRLKDGRAAVRRSIHHQDRDVQFDQMVQRDEVAETSPTIVGMLVIPFVRAVGMGIDIFVNGEQALDFFLGLLMGQLSRGRVHPSVDDAGIKLVQTGADHRNQMGDPIVLGGQPRDQQTPFGQPQGDDCVLLNGQLLEEVIDNLLAGLHLPFHTCFFNIFLGRPVLFQVLHGIDLLDLDRVAKRGSRFGHEDHMKLIGKTVDLIRGDGPQLQTFLTALHDQHCGQS